MQQYRADRAVRVLSALVSFTYYTLWVGACLALIGLPAVKLYGSGNLDLTYKFDVPATVQDSLPTLNTSWGPAVLDLSNARGKLRMPIANLPWWFIAQVWTLALIGFGFMLTSAHQLRRILQRVREGAPFDADNARRLRRLGILLLGFALFNSVAGIVTAVALRQGLAGSAVSLPFSLEIGPLVWIALVLVVLAAIFRRGAELENEQSLVV